MTAGALILDPAKPLDPRDPIFGQTPFPPWVTGFRPTQWEAIVHAYESYARGAKVVFIDAPTGTGKTLIGETVRRLLRAEKTLYVCSTKSLQDQFLHDFPYAKVLKGKSNYPTLDYPERFHNSFDPLTAEDCTHVQELLPACDRCDPGYTPLDTEMHCVYCHPANGSPYVVARSEALAAELAVLNTAYLLAEANNVGKFSKRKFVIADECDTLESVLLGYVGVEIAKYWVKRLGIERPQRRTGEAMTGQSWADWVKTEAIPKIQQGLKLPGLKNRQTNSLTRMLGDLTRLKDDLYDRERGANWVYMDDDDRIVFKPVRVDGWAKQALWAHSERWLLMSATLIDPHEQVSSLGLEDTDWDIVTVQGGFAPERRPIVVKPVVDMSKKALDNDPGGFSRMAIEVAKIVRNHPDDRVLVHTVSYKLTQEMLDKVGIVCKGRPMLSYTSSNDREAVLKEFKNTPGAVVFAPSFDRGIDLPHEMCRVQVVCKMPFASLGDKQVQKRVYGKDGNLWYSVSTIRTLVQMTGRGMRSSTDHCVTYILDKQFVSNVWSKNKRFIPKWWSEALVWDGKVPNTYWELAAQSRSIK